MKRTLIRRYLAYFLVIALTALVVSINAGSLLRRRAYEQTADALEQGAGLVRTALTAAEVEDFEAFAAAFAPEDVRITLIRPDGKVAGDSQAAVDTMENHGSRPEVVEALNGRLGIDRHTSASLAEEMVYVALPVFDHRGEGLVVRASMAVRDIRQELGGLYTRIALMGLVTLMLISLLTYLIERRMISPLPALEEAAAAFAAGRLDHYLKITYPPDLKRLAGSLNRMADTLRTRLAEVTGQKNELIAVFSSMVEAVVVLDRELRIRELNPSALRLIPAPSGEIRGRSLLQVFRSTDLDDFARRTLKSDTPQEQSLTLTVGEDIYLQAHGSLLPRDPDSGETGGVVLVMGDITKLKHLEEMRRDFVANVSHELKTPITTIKGYLETLLDGALEDKDNAERFLRIAAKNSDRLNAILDDLLSLSRLEQQKNRLADLPPVTLGEIAAEALNSCLPRANDKNIRLKLECKRPLRVRVNGLLIEQALSNLIDNAVKYSDPGSSVRIVCGRRNDQIVLEVIDSGIGIPPQDLPRVFERFYRVDKARSRELGGTGLGLAIVKHIALVHGGTVEAESHYGKGSRFTIMIPA